MTKMRKHIEHQLRDLRERYGKLKDLRRIRAI